MKTVYVLTNEPYHDNSSVRAVFLTLEQAMAAEPGAWEEWPGAGYDVPAQPGRWILRFDNPNEDVLEINEVYLHSDAPEHVQAFALALLSGDPQARDAIEDVMVRGG